MNDISTGLTHTCEVNSSVKYLLKKRSFVKKLAQKFRGILSGREVGYNVIEMLFFYLTIQTGVLGTVWVSNFYKWTALKL